MYVSLGGHYVVCACIVCMYCTPLTGIVRLPCKLLMAAWASACPWNFTKAHPVKNNKGNETQSQLQHTVCVELNSMTKLNKVAFVVCVLPLLVPSGPLNTVHSSMLPKGSNSRLTSSSLCCFPSMPTNNFLSSERPIMWKKRKRMIRNLQYYLELVTSLFTDYRSVKRDGSYHFCPPGGSIDHSDG